MSVPDVAKLVIGAFNEGNPRWRTLPRSEAGLSTGSKAFDPQLGLNNESCRAVQLMIFMKDHEGSTIAHVASVDPPSITRISICSYVWASRLSIRRSRNRAWL